MDCRNTRPHFDETLQNPTYNTNQTTQKNAMEKFQRFIFKLAETHPNAPLATAPKSFLRDRLNEFCSQYKTPDHPPYSAMIERALTELNDKNGSSEYSISQFLQRTYSNLPSAHSAFLKHHLGKLCESGELVATCAKRYMLCRENTTPKVKKKPGRRKCRWAWQREQNRLQKKKRNRLKSRTIEVNGKQNESDENEMQLAECPEDCVYNDPGVLATEVNESDEKRSYSREICPTPERPPGFEVVSSWDLNQRLSEPKPVLTIPAESSTSPKLEEFQNSPNEEKIVDSESLEVMEVQQSAMDGPKLKGDKIYFRRRKRRSVESETVDAPMEQMNPKVDSLNLYSRLANEQESQDLVVIQQKGGISEQTQLRRKRLTNCFSKHGNAKDVNEGRRKTLYRMKSDETDRLPVILGLDRSWGKRPGKCPKQTQQAKIHGACRKQMEQ